MNRGSFDLIKLHGTTYGFCAGLSVIFLNINKKLTKLQSGCSGGIWRMIPIYRNSHSFAVDERVMNALLRKTQMNKKNESRFSGEHLNEDWNFYRTIVICSRIKPNKELLKLLLMSIDKQFSPASRHCFQQFFQIFRTPKGAPGMALQIQKQ